MSHHTEFAEMAERLLHSIILSPKDVGHRSAVELAIKTADEFQKALIERRLNLSNMKLSADEILALQSGKKIEAIKLLRERTGLSLKEANRIVSDELGWL